MKKMNSYSKYQKEIIKKVTKELGSNTPFKYERTNNNHLKILIDGLDKPRYTASTPSDSKSGDNFMADLRSALKAAKLKRQPKTTPSKRMNTAHLKAQYIETLVENCIKTVRTNIDQYAQKEKCIIIEENTINNLKPLRKNLAAKILLQTKKMTRQQQYITGADNNFIKSEIIKHLNFMLPNTATYADDLKPIEKVDPLSQAVGAANGSNTLTAVNSPNLEVAHEGIIDPKQVKEAITNAISNSAETNTADTNTDTKNCNQEANKKSKIKDKSLKNIKNEKETNTPHKNPAKALAAMTKEQAIKNFRRLSRNESEAMLDYIKIAIEKNKQQDLQEVLDLMAHKGITVEMLANLQKSTV